MTVEQANIGDLTIDTVYSVKFATLQRLPIYVTVTAVTDGIATVEYRDLPDDIDPYDEKQLSVSTPVFIVS